MMSSRPSTVQPEKLPEFHQAVESRDVAKVQSLLRQKQNVKTKNYYGGTALSVAALNGHEDILHMLLKVII